MTRRLLFATLFCALAASCESQLDLGNSDGGTAGGGTAGGVAGGGTAGGATAGGTAGGATAGGAAGGSAGGSAGGATAGGATAGGAAGGATAGGAAGGATAGGGTAGGAAGGTAGSGTAVDNNVYVTDTDALYRYDVATNTLTKVGVYNCLSTSMGSHYMQTLALDSAGNLYGTTYKLFPPGQGYGALVKINPATASCSFVVFNYMTGGIFPVDMEFFPAGVVEPGKETLVGVDNGDYVKIDVATGNVTTLGDFAGGSYYPEGGVAAVAGKAYARVWTLGGGRFVAEFKPLGTGPFSGNLVRLLNFTLPDAALSFVRVGAFIYAFGTKAGSMDKVFKIDPVAETVTTLAPPVGGASVGIVSATAAPLAP